MNILVHITGLGIGGNETLLHDLLIRWKEEGTSSPRQVSLVLLNKEVADFFKDTGCEIIHSNSATPNWEEILQNRKIQFVLAFHGDIYRLALAAKKLHIPAVWSCGHPPDERDLKPLSLLFDRIILQSHFLRQHFETCLGGKNVPLQVIQNGIDLERFHCSDSLERLMMRNALGIETDTFLIGYPARLARYKAHALLLEALGELVRSEKELSLSHSRPTKFLFLISKDVGLNRKQIWRELQLMENAMGLDGRVIYVSGFSKAMPQFYSALDGVAFPAEGEGLGSAVLEAIAMGLPVILNESGGLKEILAESEDTNQFGKFVSQKNAESWAQALKESQEWEKEALVMGNFGHEYIKNHFSKSKMANAYQDLIKELVQ